MAKAPADIRSLARQWTDAAIQSLAGIATNGQSETARVAACVALLDRGWGRAPQSHTGENGDGDIRVTIRHIVQQIPKPIKVVPKTIENTERDTDAT